MDTITAQNRLLSKLLNKAQNTAYAHHLSFSKLRNYDDFATQVPIATYTDLEPWIARCKEGESNVLWPDKIDRYAVSSGTTGKGKHIPITKERLQSDLQFMRRIMWNCIKEYPDPGLFLGKHVALSGSVEILGGKLYGEISGMLALESPKWIHYWYQLNPKMAAELPWSERLEQIIDSNLNQDVRVLSGVPSWLLIFLREISKRRGKKIEEIWPNLKLIVSGGVALSGFYDVLKQELGVLRPKFIENYGASEGYFSTGFYDTGSMNLISDLNIFYEFFEIDEKSNYSNNHIPKAESLLPIWEVKPNTPYGMVITNNSGLWRYVMNDIIMFDSVDPPKIRVSGRLNEMTDSFGEALTSSEVYSVLKNILPDQPYKKVHVQSSWTNEPKTPFHRWIFIYENSVKTDHMALTNDELSKRIDDELRSINRHYANRRETKAMVEPVVSFLTFTEYEILLRKLNKAQSKLGLFI